MTENLQLEMESCFFRFQYENEWLIEYRNLKMKNEKYKKDGIYDTQQWIDY